MWRVLLFITGSGYSPVSTCANGSLRKNDFKINYYTEFLINYTFHCFKITLRKVAAAWIL